MKTKRSLLTLLTIATIVLAMTVTAFAATGTPAAGSLTVTGGTEFNGKTVEAYQVFTASWVDANETDDADDNIDTDDTISYVLESAWENYFSGVGSIAADTSNKTLSQKAAEYVANLDDTGALNLAKQLKAYAETNNIAPSYTSPAAAVSGDNAATTITNMTPGY